MATTLSIGVEIPESGPSIGPIEMRQRVRVAIIACDRLRHHVLPRRIILEAIVGQICRHHDIGDVRVGPKLRLAEKRA